MPQLSLLLMQEDMVAEGSCMVAEGSCRIQKIAEVKKKKKSSAHRSFAVREVEDVLLRKSHAYIHRQRPPARRGF